MKHAKLLSLLGGGALAVVAVMVISTAIVVIAPYLAILVVLGTIYKITTSHADKERDPRDLTDL